MSNFDTMAKQFNRAIEVGYDIKTIGTVTVKVKEFDTAGMIVRCEGTTVPTADSAGFAKGCLFVDTDAADGTKGLYENIGTTAASDFNLAGDATVGEIGLTTGSVLIGAAGVGSALDVKSSGNILVGNGTTGVSVAVSGDATLASTGALTVTDLTLGSDAAGDTFYKTSATVTARLAKGAGYQVLRMNTGATAPEWGFVNPAALIETASATATADGLTTGALTAVSGLKKFVDVTSAAATNAITLPGINVATIGQEIFLTVGANGYELLTVASSNVTINQVDSDGTNQLDVAANTTVHCTQISTTAWLAETIAATTIAITAPDND